MSTDFRGENPVNENGITENVYKFDDTHKPRIGCYEMAFIPISWYKPGNYDE
jgi:hypothetical protein